MVECGIVVKLTASDGNEDKLAGFLANALPLAQAEAGTAVWMALRTDEKTFWIVDAFPGQEERQAHLMGEIAASLGQTGIHYLAGAPEIMMSDVLAAKH